VTDQRSHSNSDTSAADRRRNSATADRSRRDAERHCLCDAIHLQSCRHVPAVGRRRRVGSPRGRWCGIRSRQVQLRSGVLSGQCHL